MLDMNIAVRSAKRQQMITTDPHDSMLNLNHAPDSIRTMCAYWALVLLLLLLLAAGAPVAWLSCVRGGVESLNRMNGTASQ